MYRIVVLILFALSFAFSLSAQYEDAPYGPEIRELISQKEYGQAQRLIDSMVARYGDGLPFDLLRVELAYLKSDTTKAFAMLDSLMQRYPDNASILYHYARCYQTALQYGQADSMYLLALGLNKAKHFTTYLKKARARLFIRMVQLPSGFKTVGRGFTRISQRCVYKYFARCHLHSAK